MLTHFDKKVGCYSGYAKDVIFVSAFRKSDGSYIFNGNYRLNGHGDFPSSGTTFSYRRNQGQGCPGECLRALGPVNDTIDVQVCLNAASSCECTFIKTLADFGEGCGVALLLLDGKRYEKRSFSAILGCNLTLSPDRMVDKSSHERLQPLPYSKILGPPMKKYFDVHLRKNSV